MKHEVRSILDGVESAVNRFDRGWPEPHTGAGNREPVDETVAPEILRRRPYLPLVLLGVALAASVAAVACLLLRSDGRPAVPKPARDAASDTS